MRRGRRGWAELVGSLGRATNELLRAELAAFGADLAASGRRLRRGSALLLVAAGLALVALWSACLAIYETLVLVLPRWGAALVLCGATALLAAALAWAGSRTLRRVESPTRLLRRRAEDHLGWWRQTLVGDEPSAGGGRPGEGDEQARH